MARTKTQLVEELEQLRLRLTESEQTLDAIRAGEVDSLVVEGPEGLRLYALEGASNTYRVLIEAMNEGAATLSDQGVILYCNSRLARMLELPLQQVMGSSLRDHVSAQLRPTFDALLRAAENTQSRGEVRLLSARGEEVPSYLSLNRILAEGTRVICLVAVDLRPQKRAEEIFAAERLASSIIEQTAEATVVCDEAGWIVRASASAVELSASNPLLTRFEEAFPVVLAGDRPSRALLEAVLSGQTFRAAPAILRRRDGLERELLVSAAPLQSTTGKGIGCVITLVDVTEARQAEQALRESEERFRTLADNIPQLAWMADGEGRRFWFNRRWSEYTGMSAEQLMGSGWLAVHDPEHVDRILKTLAQSLKAGEVWEETAPLRGADGRYRWFLVRAVPVRNDSGTVVRWFGTNTDISTHRENEDVLRQALAARDDFISVASHELRTPLTALSLQLEGLRRAIQHRVAGDESRLVTKLEKAIRQTDRLNALIEGLLNVSRIASGRFPLELETFDLVKLAQETIERIADVAAGAGCEIQLASSGPTFGTWDRSRLDQVLMNLLTNAIKYGRGKPIEVRIEGSDEGVELRVKDHGIGITQLDQERIFGRFERAVSSMHFGGLGLGLYITREIVDALGGSIKVHSAFGEGSTFVIRLPRLALTGGTNASPPAARESQ